MVLNIARVSRICFASLLASFGSRTLTYWTTNLTLVEALALPDEPLIVNV